MERESGGGAGNVKKKKEKKEVPMNSKTNSMSSFAYFLSDNQVNCPSLQHTRLISFVQN